MLQIRRVGTFDMPSGSKESNNQIMMRINRKNRQGTNTK
jgi:hypothetical protein